jgi:hypothetical protein
MNIDNEIKGYWCLPENPKSSIAGVLYTSDDGTHFLDLYGNFEGSPFLVKNNKYPIINGISSKGVQYTLVESFIYHQNMHIPGFSEVTILVNIVFENLSVTKKEDLLFKRMSASFDCMDDWVMINGFHYTDDHKSAAKIQYTLPEPIKYNVNDEFTLTINFTASTPSLPIVLKEMGIKQTVEVIIESSENNLEWYLKKIQAFKYLLMLFTNSKALRIYLQARHSKIESINPITIYFKDETKLQSRRQLLPVDFLCTYPQIKERFQDILNKWFSEFNKLESSYVLFFETIYENSISLENRYLNLVYSIENYHRNNNAYGSEYMDKKAYEKTIYPSITAAIPNDIDTDMKESLRAKIKWGFEYSLRRRIKEIFLTHGKFMATFIKDSDTLQKEIVDTRNYYTHYDEKTKFVKENSDLYQLCEKMKVIFIIAFLFDLGFKPDEIKNMVERQEESGKLINISGYKSLMDELSV